MNFWFNGATSAGSWKSCRAGLGRNTYNAGFNGATSARSWKSHAPIPAVCSSAKLQWGHERALVEMGRPAWDALASNPLQWGHERALVEIRYQPRRHGRRSCFNGATSARSWKWCELWRPPRPAYGFNGATSARSWKLGGGGGQGSWMTASMGPRARARGNSTAPTSGQVLGWLQWGHERALVEIANRGTSHGTQARFNGATSARSWKSRMAENGCTITSGFNGATSARSWKSGHRLSLVSGARASMGPRARARGNRSDRSRSCGGLWLQWGHERALVEM